MAELANESFMKVGVKDPVVLRIADSLRVQARLPHEAIWIEYQLQAYQKRSHEIRGTGELGMEDVPQREGWLIQQHPQIESAMIMHLFTQHNEVQEDGFNVWTFPFAFGWVSDDNPLPWQTTLRERDDHGQATFTTPSSILVGINKYDRSNVNCVLSPLIDAPSNKIGIEYYTGLMREWMGVVRRVWALLATIDNLPVTRGMVRQSKGFLARGRIRKYLDHHTITLNIPAKQDTRVLARRVIAIAHRKRHEVRAFWRNDWRNMPASQCNPHLWECVDDNADLIECTLCHGRQIYVHKHMRGDAGIGFSTTDYRLVHKETTA